MLSWEDNSKDYCFFELQVYISFNTMNKEEDGRKIVAVGEDQLFAYL